jgi:KTSC domain
VPVESKILLSVAHDPTKHILYLPFRSGDVYRYFDFPNETYQQFLLVESKGQFFLTNIRNGLRYERLPKLQVA